MSLEGVKLVSCRSLDCDSPDDMFDTVYLNCSLQNQDSHLIPCNRTCQFVIVSKIPRSPPSTSQLWVSCNILTRRVCGRPPVSWGPCQGNCLGNGTAVNSVSVSITISWRLYKLQQVGERRGCKLLNWTFSTISPHLSFGLYSFLQLILEYLQKTTKPCKEEILSLGHHTGEYSAICRLECVFFFLIYNKDLHWCKPYSKIIANIHTWVI